MEEGKEPKQLKEGEVISRDVAAVVRCPHCGTEFFVKKEKGGFFR